MLRTLNELYNSLKKKYLKLSPRKKWELVRNSSVHVLKFIGLPALDPKFKPWWLSYVPLIVAIDVSISFGYTIWMYRDEPLKGFLFTPLIALLIPVTTKQDTKHSSPS